MKDSQGILILPDDKLKSSEFKRCITYCTFIEEKEDYGVFEYLHASKKQFTLNQENMTNSKWIVCVEINNRCG